MYLCSLWYINVAAKTFLYVASEVLYVGVKTDEREAAQQTLKTKEEESKRKRQVLPFLV